MSLLDDVASDMDTNPIIPADQRIDSLLKFIRRPSILDVDFPEISPMELCFERTTHNEILSNTNQTKKMNKDK